MPILHIQLQGQAQTPSGQNIPVPPGDVLVQQGPVVQATIGVEQNMAAQLVQQGKTVPTPVPGLALLDTGASATCIDDDVAQQLGLPVVNQTSMVSASHTSVRNVNPCSIAVVGLPVPINALGAMGATLAPQGIIALIGRDLLRHCTLFYNGLTGEFTLSI